MPIGVIDLERRAEVLALNQQWVPHVGSLDEPALTSLLEQASFTAMESDSHGNLAGFVLVLGPGADYTSPNYRWFSDRHEHFAYVDRVVVDSASAGTGLGRRLYESVIGHARALGDPVVCCEVNLEPPNPDSQAFHERMGFSEVGRQSTYDDTCLVQLLELEL